MNRHTLVVCLVAAMTVFALSGFALAATTATTAGSAPAAADLNAKIATAKNLSKDAQTLTDEAVKGKGLDKSQPVAAGEKPQLKDLTDDERKARFSDADKKYDEAAKDVTDVLAALKKTPGVIPDPTPVKTQADVAHSAELVKNVRFLKDHKIGKPQDWLTLAQKAVKLDANNIDAPPLVTDLKAQVAAAAKKPATPPAKN